MKMQLTLENFEYFLRLLVEARQFTVFIYVLMPLVWCSLFPMKFSSKHAYDQHWRSPCNSDTPGSSLQCSESIAAWRSNISTAVLRSDALHGSQQSKLYAMLHSSIIETVSQVACTVCIFCIVWIFCILPWCAWFVYSAAHTVALAFHARLSSICILYKQNNVNQRHSSESTAVVINVTTPTAVTNAVTSVSSRTYWT